MATTDDQQAPRRIRLKRPGQPKDQEAQFLLLGRSVVGPVWEQWYSNQPDAKSAVAELRQFIRACMKAQRDNEASWVSYFRSQAARFGFRIKKLNRGQFPGRYDVINKQTDEPVASSVDVDGIKKWIDAEDKRQRREHEGRYGRGSIYDLFDLFSRHDRNYELLGVDRGATDDEIRSAYRRLAKQYHPDVNSDPEAEVRFKEITTAYEALSDSRGQRRYDTFGPRWPDYRNGSHDQ